MTGDIQVVSPLFGQSTLFKPAPFWRRPLEKRKKKEKKKDWSRLLIKTVDQELSRESRLVFFFSTCPSAASVKEHVPEICKEEIRHPPSGGQTQAQARRDSKKISGHSGAAQARRDGFCCLVFFPFLPFDLSGLRHEWTRHTRHEANAPLKRWSPFFKAPHALLDAAQRACPGALPGSK